jgi:hypothetical protein
MSRKKNQKVIKIKPRQSRFLGILFCIFAVYLLVLFIQSLTREHVSIYEVSQKQIADNENLRGIILRDEEVVTAKKSGYVNYYVGEGSRLAATTTVYSIDENGSAAQEAEAVDTADVTLSEDDTRSIRSDIANFRNNFSLSDYSSIVNFRYNVENTLLELSDINLAKNLSKIKKESGDSDSFSLVKAKQTGIISFCSDGLENLQIDEITQDYFKEMTDQWEQLRTGKSVKKGSAVYRVVKSEKWSLIVSLTKEQFQKLSQKEQVTVKIKKDSILLTPTVRTFTSDGNYYANLIFDKYMIHYLNNRYLDIEIQFNNAEGLKIPVASILKKKCYVIPENYITQGDGTSTSNKKGVVALTYTKSGQEQLDFIPVEIYWKDEDGNVYIDANLFDTGTTIINESGGTDKKLSVTQVEELEGVYNCNQGYCVFKYIHKLYENQEYAIIEKGNSYSLSSFDHIILNPDIINENDIIY